MIYLFKFCKSTHCFYKNIKFRSITYESKAANLFTFMLIISLPRNYSHFIYIWAEVCGLWLLYFN